MPALACMTCDARTTHMRTRFHRPLCASRMKHARRSVREFFYLGYEHRDLFMRGSLLLRKIKPSFNTKSRGRQDGSHIYGLCSLWLSVILYLEIVFLSLEYLTDLVLNKSGFFYQKSLLVSLWFR